MEKPPVLPRSQKSSNTRWAWTLNLIVPGAGQLLLGQIALGSILVVAFLIDFAAMLVLFLADFSRYLELAGNGKILEGDNIEKVAGVYHVTWLLVLLGIGIIIYVVSFVALARKEASTKT